jgi:hypothetical protein
MGASRKTVSEYCTFVCPVAAQRHPLQASRGHSRQADTVLHNLCVQTLHQGRSLLVTVVFPFFTFRGSPSLSARRSSFPLQSPPRPPRRLLPMSLRAEMESRASLWSGSQFPSCQSAKASVPFPTSKLVHLRTPCLSSRGGCERERRTSRSEKRAQRVKVEAKVGG